MSEHLAPLETEPVSVHPPYDARPDGHYRHGDDDEERYAALSASLHGVALGAYDRSILRWLTRWETSVIAMVASLLWRVRHTTERQGRDGGASR